MNSLLVLGAIYGFYVYFEPLAKTELGQNQQEKMKFEVKKAGEMEERLKDVKGLKEIT